MKKIMMTIMLMCVMTTLVLADNEVLKPYTLAGVQQGELMQVRDRVSELVAAKGFEVVGSYSPAEDEALSVICVTHPLLRKNAEEVGGLLGLSAVLRLGLYSTEAGVEVAYTTPQYWGNAYYQKDYSKVATDYETLAASFQEALSGLDETTFSAYGSEKGLSTKKLQKYNYMMSMPRFDDVVVLQKDLPCEEAISRIETRAAGNPDLDIVYAVKFPEQHIALFGVALKGEHGEKKFLPKIDFAEPRHTPFLPYEILVQENQTVMLHGKYRIALSFPDLTMGTFMKIMSTPGDIEEALGALVVNEE